jgi:predicted NUDIX family NTP pyrophosphohydrolase
MPKQSAGLLIHRIHAGRREIFLVHPGGPFWAKKDDGAWSIPKGEFLPPEDPLEAARREFHEETGYVATEPFTSLGTVKLSGGKVIHAFAATVQDLDPTKIVSNTFEIEWPPRSGKRKQFPEVDRASWFDEETAARKINVAQAALLSRI